MSSLTIPVTATVGGLGILKLIIHSLRGTSSIKEPPPPTECFGQYCIKAESKLARKNKNKNKDVKRQDTVYKIYKGYDKNMEIIGKVENMCKKYITDKNDDTLYCTRPEITFNRHLQMCNGQIEIHYPGSDTITIIP